MNAIKVLTLWGGRSLASRLLLAGCIAALAATTVSADDDRFTAVFADGSRAMAAEVAPWHDPGANPKLGNRPLFDPANPVRWLRDNALLPAAPPAVFVEFWLGDRLPGRVTGFRPATAGPYRALPARLVVTPEGNSTAFDPQRSGPLEVLTRYVRRVVWQRRTSDNYEPGTVFYRDGRQVKFRSLRWAEGSVRLLLAEGTSDVPLHHIAELHMPRVDPWEAYYEQVASLASDEQSLLLRVECSDGLRATASTDRFQAARHRDAGNPDTWVHGLQPAWCLSPLWLKHRAIRLRQYTSVQLVPLSLVDVARVTRRPVLSRGWNWQLDRNVQGGPLRNGGEEFAWGFGVQAFCELEFELPAAARTFRTRLALDEAAGRGGCVRGRVLLRQNQQPDQPLHESELIVGTAAAADSGALAIAAAGAAQRRLVLQADAAHDGRPPGADPFDIRDVFDWLEPMLELDAAVVRSEAARRASRIISAWDGWTVEDEGGLTLSSLWDPSAAELGVGVGVTPRGPFLKLSRNLRVTAERPWLLLAISRPPDAPPARIQVQIADQAATTLEVPVRYNGSDPDPLAISLAEHAGQEVAVTIVQQPAGDRALVEWRAIALAARPPGELALFDEDVSVVQLLNDGTGKAVAVEQEAASGQLALTLTGGERRGTALAGLPVRIRATPRLGEYRYLRFAWRNVGGDRICLGLGHGGLFGPEFAGDSQPKRSYRYDAGTGGQSMGLALRLDNKLPERWTVVSRDLFADFGEFELTGLSLNSPDGESAHFDGIYLLRTDGDARKLEERFAEERK